MSTKFQERIQRGINFERWLIAYLQSLPEIQCVTKNGAREKYAEPFHNRLRELQTSHAKFLRYAPDGMYIGDSNAIYYFDAKVGLDIEKDAYETYVEHQHIFQCEVLLFVLHDERVFWQRISEIEFQDAEMIVSRRYPPHMRFIASNPYFYPRETTDRSHVAKNMSGTPYAMIEPDCLRLLMRKGQPVIYQAPAPNSTTKEMAG